jgi:hypothetical protein
MLTEPLIPTIYPPFLTAGTTFKVDREFDDFPNTQWNYSLLLAGLTTQSFAASNDQDGVTFHIVLTPTQTQPMNPVATATMPLPYAYTERLIATDGSGEIFDIVNGRIMVNPNMAGAVAGSLITYEEQTLAVIEAALKGRLTADIEHYSIAGRSVSKIPVRELIELRGRYKYLCQKQRNPGSFSNSAEVKFPSIAYGPDPYLPHRWGWNA